MKTITIGRARRTIVILAGTVLSLMMLFPPVTATITYKPGPLPGKPFEVVDGVRPEPSKTAREFSKEAHDSLLSPYSPPVYYRFIAQPPLSGSAAETVDFGSNTMVEAQWGVAWVVLLRNVMVLLLVSGASFLIAAPQNKVRG